MIYKRKASSNEVLAIVMAVVVALAWVIGMSVLVKSGLDNVLPVKQVWQTMLGTTVVAGFLMIICTVIHDHR